MTSGTVIDDLVRSEVGALPRYGPDPSSASIDLSDNTNLWGAPPGALKAVHEATSTSLARYPSLYGERVRHSALRYLGLGGSTNLAVVTGCGSDDLLDSTMRAFGTVGDSIAFSSPTFTMIPVFARLNGLGVLAVPLTAHFDVDAQRLVDCAAKITYLCAPNNPTATAVSRAAIEFVVSNAKGIVVIDEAYAEFAPEVFTDLVVGHERVIIARTFSKAFGLAGLRMGYGVAHLRTAELLERARGPYKVTAMAEHAALAVLEPGSDGLDWVREHAALAVAIRDRLIAALRHCGLAPLPSVTNFVLVPTARAAAIAEGLRQRGVLVRAFSGLPREIPVFAESGGAAIRVGVGPWDMMQAMLDCLTSVLA